MTKAAAEKFRARREKSIDYHQETCCNARKGAKIFLRELIRITTWEEGLTCCLLCCFEGQENDPALSQILLPEA